MKEEGRQPTRKHPRKDGEEAGCPHFQSKKQDRLSFSVKNETCRVDGSWLSVPKVGRVKMSEPLRLAGLILSAVIFEQAGHCCVCIALDVAHLTPSHRGAVVGIELGLKSLAVTSEGEGFEHQTHPRRHLGGMKRLSKG